MKKESPIADLTALALIEARRLVEINPGFFHAIILDDWRGARLIFDSDASVNCSNNCASCRHSRLFPPDRPEAGEPELLRQSLYPFTSEKDRFLYGPERFLPCKTAGRYAECFIRCILLDEDMKDPDNLEEELTLVKNFFVIWTDSSDGNERLAVLIKQNIVFAILAGAPEEQRKSIVTILAKLGWDFARGSFV